MKGIDTNVLVRYILQDDARQGALAAHFVEKNCSRDEPAFINGIILCELVWVLETAYEYSRAEIIPVLEKILHTQQFHIHEPQIIWQALRGYKTTSIDFADHYINSLNLHNDCEYTVTFDKKASRVVGFKLLS